MDNLNTPGIDKTIESRSHYSDSFFKSIAMNGPAAIAIVQAADLRITFINNTFEYYLGYSNADIEEKDLFFSSLLPDYMNDRLTYQLSTVREDFAARSKYVIYRLTGKDNQKIPFYLYVSPISKSPDGLTEDSYYITLHPELSKWDMPFSSFSSRELFLEQFNSEDFGTFEWIMDVDKVFWSVGVYRIYEVDDTRTHINNLFARAFIHPADKARVTEAMNNALVTNEDLNIEFKIVTAKNKVKIIHSLARILKNDQGIAVKFVGSIRDITSQRLIEEDLKNKVEELHHSNRELEEFAYIASHDMQEPLRKITTFSDRLSEKYKAVLAGDGAMYLSRMTASAENMRSLINDLLDFSRISKTVQPFEQVNLNVILRMVKNELELKIEETGTVINNTPLPTIDAIASQMKQLFVNIISNAIKFHKQGVAPQINIEAGPLTSEEVTKYELQQKTQYQKITVTDNGIGFEDEYALRIFQVFQRLHGKSEYPGSGIGLAICKKILEYHGGIIFAENVPATGARFTFILPQQQKPKANNQ